MMDFYSGEEIRQVSEEFKFIFVLNGKRNSEKEEGRSNKVISLLENLMFVHARERES